MANLHNNQPILGVAEVAPEVTIYNGLPVIGARASAATFEDNKVVLGVSVLTGGSAVSGGVSISRATEATYVGEDGSIKTAAIDEPRYDWSGGERALLVEAEATNLFLTSSFPAAGSGYQDATLEDVPFAKSASGSALRVTRTTTGIANKGLASRAAGPTEAGVKYCFSATVRPGPYGAKIQHTAGLEVSIDAAGVVTNSKGYGVFATSPLVTRSSALGDGCFRVSISGTPSANVGTQSVWLHGGSYHTNPVGAWAEYAGVQIETGVDYPTSLIPTAGSAATRAADILRAFNDARVVGVVFIDDDRAMFNNAEVIPVIVIE